MLNFVKYFPLLLFVFIANDSLAQYLQPGFDKGECAELMRINTTFSESKKNRSLIPAPIHSKLIYASPNLGLDNKWELWIKDNQVAVIGIRGSTKSSESWLSNLFAVQIPAIGDLIISKDFHFPYKLAENPKAAVHAGYVFSTAFLLDDMLPKIDSLYAAGIKDIIITGHSQGGGLSYLLAANLLWRQRDGLFPKDIRIKVYTSASPKPGNLYFAYDYDRVALEGWSYNVVNTEDWVPQSPFTVQTVSDLPSVNPMTFITANIKKQSFFKRIFFRSIYKNITNPPIKAVDTYQKYLGNYVGKMIKKEFKEFEIPEFSKSSDYVRVSNQVVLFPDTAYFKIYNAVENPDNFMLHHSINAYYYLLLHHNLD